MLLPGQVIAAKETPVYAHISGEIVKIYHSEGALVKPGDILAEIDNPARGEKNGNGARVSRKSQASIGNRRAWRYKTRNAVFRPRKRNLSKSSKRRWKNRIPIFAKIRREYFPKLSTAREICIWQSCATISPYKR